MSMQSGFNEGTTKENSDLVTDIRLAEKYGFDVIELRLDKIETFLRQGSLEDLEKELEKGIFPMARLVTHRFPLSRVQEGLEAMVGRTPGYIKGVIEM